MTPTRLARQIDRSWQQQLMTSPNASLEFCAELRRSGDHRLLLAAFLLEDAATDCRRVASELRAAQALLGTTEQAPVPALPQYRKSTQYQPPERHRP